MAVQTIGLEGRFDTAQFSAGLRTYVDGLKQATDATRRAAKEISGLGTNLSAAFGQGGSLSQTLIPAINRMSQGFQRTNQVVSQTGHIFNQNKALLEATQAQIRDNIRLAELRAIKESANTSELQKQLAFLESLSIKSSSIERKASLRQQGFSPLQIQGALRSASATPIDPLRDFSSGALKTINNDLSKFQATSRKVSEGLSNIKKGADTASDGLNKLTVAGVAVGVALGQVAYQAITRIISSLTRLASTGTETAVFFERLGLSINFFAARTARQQDETLGFRDAMAQTSQEAQGLLLWIKQLAVASPFTAKQVGTVFRVSQAYGLLAEEAQVLLPLLIDLGSATGLDPQTLENDARALGQIRSRSKLTGEEIRQLGNAGIPIRDILVENLKITQEEFDQLLESGALISDAVIPAIVDSLKEFEGAAERVAFSTIGGLLSAFEDIKDIGLGEFFSAILGPLQPLLLNLVETLNDPAFRAGLLLIGEDIGNVITNAIHSLQSAITGLIKAWQNLNPQTKEAIILFAAVFAGSIALIGIFSLLFFAINALVNPVTIVAFLIAEWITSSVTGFSILGKVVEGFGRVVSNVFSGIVGFFDRLLSSVFNLTSVAEEGFTDTQTSAREFGRGTGEAFGKGFAEGGISGLGQAINEISAYLTGELKPASIPPGLPPIDNWMRDSGRIGGVQLGEGVQQGFEETIKGTESVFDRRIRVVNEAILRNAEGEAEKYRQQGRRMGLGFGDAVRVGTEESLQDTKAVIEKSGDDLGESAYAAGIKVGDAFTRGFGLLFRRPADIVNPAIEKLINAIGGGRQLSRSGAEAFGKFLDGFLDADFGALDTASGLVENFLGSLASLGDIQDIDVPRTLFATREALAKAVGEARKFGTISSEAFNRVKNAAAGLGPEVNKFLGLYTNLVVETEAVTRAQEELNAVTEKYDNLLDPLKDKLEEASNERQTAQEIKQIAGLQRILNSSITTAENKRIAAAQIIEIQTRQQIRALEIQRKKEEGLAQDSLKQAQDKEESAKSELDLFEARLNAQLDQLGIVADEAKIVERLQNELDKTQEKELSVLERQLKFAALQKAELSDTLAAAKARVDLEDASSSEQEKAAANLQLQTIALNRLKREQEAVELGFSVEDLIPLRELSITLDDINKKSKDGGGVIEPQDLDTSGLVKPKELLENFGKTLDTVREKWEAFKGRIVDALVEINSKLPPFLQLFDPSLTGDNVPIIDSLIKIGEAILYIGAAWKITDFLYKIFAVIGFLKYLGVGALVAKVTAPLLAIAGGGATAAAGLGLLIAAVVAFAVAYTFNLGGVRDFTNEWVKGIVADFTQAGYAIRAITAAIKRYVKESLQSIFSPEEVNFADILQEEVNRAALLLEGIDDSGGGGGGGFGGIGDSAKVGGINAGTNYGTGFVEGTQAILQDSGLQDGIISSVTQLSNSAGDEFLTSFKNTVNTGTAGIFTDTLGLSPADTLAAQNTGADIGRSMGEGIPIGLAQTEYAELRAAAEKLVADQVAELKNAAEAESPSQLTAREVGVPLGEGIRDGMLSVETSSATKQLINGIIDEFEDLKTKASRKFTELNTLLIRKNKELQTSLTRQTQETNDSLLASFQKFIDDLLIDFTNLFDDILTGWETLGDDTITEVTNTANDIIGAFDGLNDEIIGTSDEKGLRKLKKDIVGIWTTLKDEQTQPLADLKTQILNAWIGEEGSIFSELQNALFGTGDGTGTDTPVWNLGLAIMGGIAQGITDNGYVVRNALRDSLVDSLGAVAGDIKAQSPSEVFAEGLGMPISQGVAKGILDGAGLVSQAVSGVIGGALGAAISPLTSPGLGTAVPSSVSNVSNSQTFNLNVNSAQTSQGIISDFSIMRTMAAI